MFYFSKKGGQILGLWAWCAYKNEINEKALGAENKLTLTVLAKCFIH